MSIATPEWAFKRYEEVRGRLPAMPSFDQAPSPLQVDDLAAIDPHFDVFLFDAFGVLNVGETVLEEAPKRLASLREKGKQVFILTNAASQQKQAQIEKYKRFGFNLADECIVSSREILLQNMQDDVLAQGYERIGIITICDLSDWPKEASHIRYDYADDADNQAFYDCDAFVFMSSGKWNESHQIKLEAELKKRPRPVYVGNPDIVAPRETHLSLEPGYYAHQLMDITNVKTSFYGKPYDNAFEEAISRAKRSHPDLQRNRVLMIGDTLHTDILGGKAVGISTALVTNYGAYKQGDPYEFIKKSGIYPEYVMPTI